tara:strand:+ start:809 stop:1102 length:294 start_codon:yes stop_codon:yes gene_type:complete
VNKLKKDTLTRSDIETSQKKEFKKLTKSDITESINSILNTITEAVALDKKVEIRGFGTFSKKNIRPRKFINPKTKEISFVGETSRMHFKPSKKLLEK